MLQVCVTQAIREIRFKRIPSKLPWAMNSPGSSIKKLMILCRFRLCNSMFVPVKHTDTRVSCFLVCFTYRIFSRCGRPTDLSMEHTPAESVSASPLRRAPCFRRSHIPVHGPFHHRRCRIPTLQNRVRAYLSSI